MYSNSIFLWIYGEFCEIMGLFFSYEWNNDWFFHILIPLDISVISMLFMWSIHPEISILVSKIIHDIPL